MIDFVQKQREALVRQVAKQYGITEEMAQKLVDESFAEAEIKVASQRDGG